MTLRRLLALLLTLARALPGAAARALSPPGCAACDASCPGDLCPACAASVRRITPHRDRAPSSPEPSPHASPEPSPQAPPIVAFAAFEGAVAAALRRFKYRSRPDLAKPLGRLLGEAARDADLRADLVIPVPLHPRRLAERGYNQAALLAAEVAGALDAVLVARALTRVRDTAQQARLARGDRLGNVGDAFTARWPERIRGRAVVLIDDVATTGATLAACAEALRRAGAASVIALVVARAGARDAPDAPDDAS